MMFQSTKPLQVTEITQLIKINLERDFSDISVEGEISNFKRAASGHCYFSLKDREALLQAVIFRGSASSLPFSPKDGQKVIARGRISLYPQRGSYQLVCQTMKLSGQGDILQILEERKQRLAQEGLFDPSKRKGLPTFPVKVGVVTSPTGAAIRDILQVLERRNPNLSVIIFPAAVQGENAPGEICLQIERANELKLTDLLIIGRGGGSLEDLLAFSDESVVRAVHKSDLPIVSAVGHEIDIALTDYAADMRAPTPSAAAELVTPDMEMVIQRIEDIKEDLGPSLRGHLTHFKQRLDFLGEKSLKQLMDYQLEPKMMHLDSLKEGLISSMEQLISNRHQDIALKRKELESLSPKALLERGFAYVCDDKNKHIHDATELKQDDMIHIQFYRNGLTAKVEDIENEGI